MYPATVPAGTERPEMPTVSVVVPCRNENGFIERFVSSLLAQEPVDGGIEIIIADGESNDGTWELLNELAAGEPRLVPIKNPKRIVSAGLNAAIRRARGQIIVRMDVHTRYAPDYLRACVRVLRESGADNVGGPWRAEATGFLQQAIALAFNSKFAVGGARSRDDGYEGDVDTVYLGCWRKDYLEKIGAFDEDLVRNQDDELNLRILRSGGCVWQSPAIRSWYSPRATLKGLFLQYLQYGYWKIRVIQKHRIPASPRHIVPATFVFGLGALTVIAPFSIVARHLLGWGLASYVMAAALAAIAVAPKKARTVAILPAVFACFHFGYGIGSLAGLWNFFVRKTTHHTTFERITRG